MSSGRTSRLPMAEQCRAGANSTKGRDVPHVWHIVAMEFRHCKFWTRVSTISIVVCRCEPDIRGRSERHATSISSLVDPMMAMSLSTIPDVIDLRSSDDEDSNGSETQRPRTSSPVTQPPAGPSQLLGNDGDDEQQVADPPPSIRQPVSPSRLLSTSLLDRLAAKRQ